MKTRSFSDCSNAHMKAACKSGQSAIPLRIRGSFYPLGVPLNGAVGIRLSGQEAEARCVLPCATAEISIPYSLSIQIKTSTFHGNIPVNGSGPNEPSLATPSGNCVSSMPIRAFLRVASI